MAETKKKDRHRPGYFKDYAKRTGRKDRHRKGYYREYNLKHPERIAHLLEMISFYEISDRPELVTSLEFLARGIRHIEETAQEEIESLWHLEDKIA